MTIPPAGPSVAMSSAEPLSLSEDASRRFPYATAYLGLQLVLTGLLIFPALALSTIRSAVVRLIIQIVLYLPVLFFVFRWAIEKHVLPRVTPTTSDLANHGRRFSFKNPFLTGLIAYWAMTWLTSAVVAPITEPLKQDLGSVGIALAYLVDVVVGYLPFRIAVKRVVLQPYRAKRLVPLLGLMMVLALSVSVAIPLSRARREWAFQNHVYCEILQPGMTVAEVTTALSAYGLVGQINWEHEFEGPGAEYVASFTTPWFNDRELRYRLNLVMGYNSEDKLMLIGREEYFSTVGMSYTLIECPLPFLR